MGRLEELLKKKKQGILSPREKLELVQLGYEDFRDEDIIPKESLIKKMLMKDKPQEVLPSRDNIVPDSSLDRAKAYEAMQRYEQRPVETTQDRIRKQDQLMGSKSDFQRQRENQEAKSLADEFSMPSPEQEARLKALQRIRQGR